MALKLNKSEVELEYFYEENGNTLGPFALSALLSKITENTLVYREGIEWTSAKNIPELSKFFGKTEDLNKKSKSNFEATTPIIDQPKKKKNTFLWPMFFLLGIVLVFYFSFFKNNTGIRPDSSNKVDSSNALSNSLSEFEIFDLNTISKFNPSDNQKNLASNFLIEASDAIANKDYILAITKYKESLKNSPQAKVYFNLSDAYFMSKDYNRAEQCLELANNLDYQPKSELNLKLLVLHAAKGEFELVTNEILNLSNTNHSILNKVERDSVFYNYRHSPDYLKIIERNAIMDTLKDNSIYYNIITQYYNDLNNQIMDASNYYSENVNQFINKISLSPEEINEIISSNSEFIDSKINLIGNSLIITSANSRQAWVKFSCYRSSKKKFQNCRVKVEFIFDENDKIISYRELEIKDLIFLKTNNTYGN